MRNPLNKRLPRELKAEFGKYLVIFLLLTASIGLISGFLVACDSMIIAYNESFEKYNIEDGHFELERKANKAQLKSIQSLGIRLYENYFIEEKMSIGASVRIFQNRQEVNRACLMKGRFPEKTGEIAIDRMFADNNNLVPGDTLEGEFQTYTITGLVALSDYSALFSNNNDIMFDAVQFCVGVVAPEQFAAYDQNRMTWSYAWKYNDFKLETSAWTMDDGLNSDTVDTAEEREISDRLLEDIRNLAPLKTFIPRYQNQAIKFTGEDMGSDKAMMSVLLYMIIAIIAFVFAVTISDTISKEAGTIGTLRASGYTRGELVRHYMSMPLIVTLISALAGNIAGYTVFEKMMSDLYYGSYSLPTYKMIWHTEAFIKTTLIPILIMAVVTFIILTHKLRLSPQQFLRRDLSRRRKKRAVRLPHRIPFFTRFRMRVIFQNLPNYLVLAAGILFANLLLMFGLMLPQVMDDYAREVDSHMIADYQYILTLPIEARDDDHKLASLFNMLKFKDGVETDNPDAEKFSVYTLQTPKDPSYKQEEIMLYGIEPESRYLDFGVNLEDLKGPEETGAAAEVVISRAYAEKYQLEPGDSFTLEETYEDQTYVFTVASIFDYYGSVSVYMSRSLLNQVFDYDKDFFCGYLSDSAITDIDEQYIGTIIDYDALTKISRQLNISMGSMADIVVVFAVVMFMILIYLLSKIVIEKNAQSISMTKILGYTNGEISRLYIMSTTIVVIVLILLSIPVIWTAIRGIMVIMLRAMMTGWLPINPSYPRFVEMVILGIGSYAFVALLEYRRITRIPMDEALKNVE
ncbi:MAG: ABC transporter permease [Lachnospiraceae bacterium]